MILKSADDKSKRLQLLEDLQRSALLDPQQKKWLREQLSRQRKGIQGEKDSAFYLDQYFKNGENHVVLHDLRFEFEGDVAQIDHLIINRAMGMYLLETKNYAGNLVINDHGEFTAHYDEDSFGIPSPLEQSRRHERILLRLLERLEIKNRSGGPMDLFHVVMLHPQAKITRPPARMFDTSTVIKADQFPTWHQQFVDKEIGLRALLKGAVNMRSLETIKEWGEKLVRQHRPANQLELPEFMQPKKIPQAAEAPAISSRRHVPLQTQQSTSAPETEPQKKLICAQCGIKISYAEGKFCWNSAQRFGGRQYCREHQQNFH